MVNVASLSICFMFALYYAKYRYSIFCGNLPSTFNKCCWNYFLIGSFTFLFALWLPPLPYGNRSGKARTSKSLMHVDFSFCLILIKELYFLWNKTILNRVPYSKSLSNKIYLGMLFSRGAH